MKKRNIVIVVIGLLIVIAGVFIFINNSKTAANDCQKFDTTIDSSINKKINEYTLNNRDDIFFYDSTQSYSNLNTKSTIKYSQENGNLIDYITRIYLFDGDSELTSQVVRLSIENNEIVDLNHVLGARDEIIDGDIKKENYNNILEDKCDIQQEMK